MTAVLQSAKRKLSLLQLAEELGNVSKACKIMGYHRDSFYEIRRAFQVELPTTCRNAAFESTGNMRSARVIRESSNQNRDSRVRAAAVCLAFASDERHSPLSPGTAVQESLAGQSTCLLVTLHASPSSGTSSIMVVRQMPSTGTYVPRRAAVTTSGRHPWDRSTPSSGRKFQWQTNPGFRT